MFIYEDRKNNRINVVLEGHLPVDEPDMVLGVGSDGAITLVAGDETIVGAGIEDETAAEETEEEAEEAAEEEEEEEEVVEEVGAEATSETATARLESVAE